jgi:hypothetical protein
LTKGCRLGGAGRVGEEMREVKKPREKKRNKEKRIILRPRTEKARRKSSRTKESANIPRNG